MDYHDRIAVEPGKRGGKPCLRGLRITVHDVRDYPAGGMREDEILADSPSWSARISGQRWHSQPNASASLAGDVAA